VLPALRVETLPHLGRGLDDKGDGKPLPKKTNEMIRGLCKENPNQLKGTTFIETEDSTWGFENYPKCYFKYIANHGVIKSDYKYKQLASMTIHKGMLINHGTNGHNQHLTSGPVPTTYPGPMGVPRPVPESR